jgi:5'-nucleotidase
MNSFSPSTLGQQVALLSQNLNSEVEHSDTHRPVVGLDLDGVIFKYEKGFSGFLVRKLGRPITDFPTMTNYSTIASGWPIRDQEEFKDLHCEAVNEGLYEQLEVMEGAVEALQRLARDGYKIRVITARFVRPGQHAEVVRQTMVSLDRAGIPVKDISFTSEKTEINADVYVDDAPYNIVALRAVGKKVIPFAQPYNTEFEGRADNWVVTESLIRELAPLG